MSDESGVRWDMETLRRLASEAYDATEALHEAEMALRKATAFRDAAAHRAEEARNAVTAYTMSNEPVLFCVVPDCNRRRHVGELCSGHWDPVSGGW